MNQYTFTREQIVAMHPRKSLYYERPNGLDAILPYLEPDALALNIVNYRKGEGEKLRPNGDIEVYLDAAKIDEVIGLLQEMADRLRRMANNSNNSNNYPNNNQKET